MTASQKNAIKAYWPCYGLEFQQDRLELPAGFDALKLEIGIGNGDALIHMAAADTSSLYLGIEVHEPGIGRCLNLVQQLELANVRLMRHDAVEVLEHMIAPEMLDRILLFFPDPWHKKRHHKRRIVNQSFRDLVYRALKSGASIHIATDWQDYAESIACAVSRGRTLLQRGRCQWLRRATGLPAIDSVRATRPQAGARGMGPGVY